MDWNKKEPLVSICMPAYNAAKYIDATLESILNQTYRNIEIVIVNDGSTDGTDEILGKYGRLENVRIFHTENRGQCAAANRAYKESTGEYIKFFDADDIMNPEHIAAQVKRALQRPNCIPTCTVRRFYNDDLSTAVHEPVANWKDLPPLEWMVIDNGAGLWMIGACMFLIPRAFLQRSGLWNESLSLLNDYEFSPRFLLLADEILFTPEAELFYRSGLAGSLSQSVSRSRLQSAYTALASTESLLLQYDDSARVRSALAQLWHQSVQSFYLDAMDLYRMSEKHLRDLGDYPDLYFQQRASRLRKFVGWKNHKRITRLLAKLRKLIPG
jgi:glycosyltransferase involved in cell wall biosynthesis